MRDVSTIEGQAERTAFVTSIGQLENRINDLNAEYKLLLRENERLKAVEITKIKEVEDLKNKLTALSRSEGQELEGF